MSSTDGGNVRGWVAVVALAAATVLALVALGGDASDEPLSPRSHERLGTSALVALARELGAEVSIDDRLPDLAAGAGPDVMVMFTDLLDDDQRTVIDDWIDQGGRLVVTEPASDYAPPVAGTFDTGAELSPARTLAGRCEIDALDGLDLAAVEPYNAGALYDAPARADSCIDDVGGRAHVVATDRGEGAVVALGGSGMVVNAGLATGENAAVVAALVAPQEGTEVLVLEPGRLVGGGGQRTLRDLIPSGVSRAIVQLGIAFALYALWRARRLGRPVAEPQPVAVAGSELVAAAGNLLDRSHSAGYAGEMLRADLRRFLTDRLGVPAGVPPDVLATVAAQRTGVAEDTLRWALGTAPVTDDAGLTTLAHTIDRIREEVLDHV